MSNKRGITFNGVHSSTLFLVVEGSARPLLPQSRDSYIDIPHKSGSVLDPDNSKSDIEVEIDFAIALPRNSPLTIWQVARQVADWLWTTNRAPLIFDDDPEYIYQAKYDSSTTIERIVRYGKFTVTFRCLPESGERIG